MRYLDLLNSAISNAQRGLTPEQAANVDDVLAIADTLFPVVSQAVCEAVASNEYRRSLVLKQKSITLAAGIATLSDDVLTHFIPDAVLIDPTALTKKYAWRPYPDFVRRGDLRLGVFSMRGGSTLVVCDPNVAFAATLTTTGARTLTVPCAVEKPATFSTAIDCPDELLTDLDEGLSNALRGFITSKEAGAAA